MQFEGSVIKSVQPVFKTKMLVYHSKANKEGRILFDEIIHFMEPEIRKIRARGCTGGTKIPHSILVQDLLAIEVRMHF